MASPCEVLMDTSDPLLSETLFQNIKNEAERLEAKYSRYKTDNIVHQINTSEGREVRVDDETASLIDFAFYCYELSDGLFDITSGVLRKIWNFKEFKKFPEPQVIKECLQHVGLRRVKWKRPVLKLEKGMELDFGGIVKEYAVDKCLALVPQNGPAVLINFGGDLAVNKVPASGSWSVAIEEAFKEKIPEGSLQLKSGALATSGNTHRYFEHNGKRYSHILNPKTGMPVSNGVATITVHAPTCTTAGMLATISHLQNSPKGFLEDQDVKYWILQHK